MIIGIIVGIIVLVVALLGVAIFFLRSPSIQAKNTSTLFMHYITAGDAAKAATYSTGTASNLATITPSVRGSYSLSQSTMQSGKGYYLYNLVNAKDKYARTTVQKTGSTWKVVSFVFSAESLKLVPSGSVATTTTISPTTTADATCLVPTDYNILLKEINDSTAPNTYVYTHDVQFIQNVHFNADSLNFVDPVSSQEGMVSSFADFYKANTTKKFTIHLYGSVATTAASDLSFANQRAEKVKSLLEANGVPASYIVIDAAQNINSAGGSASNSTDQATSRVVVLKVDPGTTCNGKSSTGR